MIAEIPLGIIGVEVPFCQSRSTVGYGVKHILLVDAFLAGDSLRHDAESTVGQLFDTPELFVATGKGRNGLHFQIFGGGQCTVGSFDGNLEVGVA